MGVRRAAADLFAAYPGYTFEAGEEFFFDAADEVIYYDPSQLGRPQGQIALLHEIAHAELNHFDYSSDLELVLMEARAWDRTRTLATQHQVQVDTSYIDHCLAGYSRWLASRATCPHCMNFSLQSDPATYHCFRCHTRWSIQVDAMGRSRRQTLS